MFWNLTGINYQVRFLYVPPPASVLSLILLVTTKYRLLVVYESGIFAEFDETTTTILGLMKRYFIIHKKTENDKWFLTKGIQLL